jgi:3-hydroxyacyl-CoA dehydrogenase
MNPRGETAVTSSTKIAVIGAGLIGRAWAIVFARAGFAVAIYDAAPGAAEAALGLIAEGLAQLARAGLVDDAKAAAARVRIAASVADAVQDADFVQENLPENLDVKRAIFAELDRLSPPDAILASSTSTIVPSLFTERLKGRSRCLVAHPVNPPHLVPIVELVGAPWAAPQTIARAKALYEQAGQVPVVVKKEIEGFILNRLQAVLLSEAFRLVAGGYVSPQDLDKTIKDGLGLRWSFMGPFETIELNAPGGIPDYCERYGKSLASLSAANPSIYGGDSRARILGQWGEAPTSERVAARMRWRDRRLAALQAHKRSQRPA